MLIGRKLPDDPNIGKSEAVKHSKHYSITVKGCNAIDIDRFDMQNGVT